RRQFTGHNRLANIRDAVEELELPERDAPRPEPAHLLGLHAGETDRLRLWTVLIDALSWMGTHGLPSRPIDAPVRRGINALGPLGRTHRDGRLGDVRAVPVVCPCDWFRRGGQRDARVHGLLSDRLIRGRRHSTARQNAFLLALPLGN